MIRLHGKEPMPGVRQRYQKVPSPRRNWIDNIVSKALSVVLMGIVRRYKDDAINLAKIEAVSLYVKALGKARMAFIGYVLMSCVLLLLLSGFVLFHVALFAYLPWTIQSRALLLLVLGVIYFVVALGILIYASSERNWMKYSKADEMTRKVTHL